MKNDPRSCERDLRNCVRSLKKIQDFNGIWTLDLAIPVRRSSSNQLSYEATDVFSGQVCVHMFPFSSLSREHMNSYFTSSQHQWLHSIASVSRGHGFKSRWSPGFFFRLLTQLHKLGSQQRRSFFIWFDFCGSHIWFVSYTCHYDEELVCELNVTGRILKRSCLD